MTEQRPTVAALRRPWRSPMAARDPGEDHRAATPLELFFDLCFVVAVAQAAVQLAHGIEENHVGPALLGYAMVFFAIWWAWMNFTWFASAYDTDDVPYRLLTLAQMAGVLVLAAGIPAAFEHFDFTVMTIGYTVMRVPMIAQWLRAAREDPAGRPTAVRYAIGIAVVQVLWLLRLLLPMPFGAIAFVVLVLAEIAVPPWAEAHGVTAWHREHIAERYGLLTLIVLGEGILGATVAVQAGITEAGLTPELLMLAAGGLLLLFGVWWTYFLGGDEAGLTTMRTALTWGYGHYLVFAAIAALASGLEVAVQVAEHTAHVPPIVAGLAVAVPLVVFLVVISGLRLLTWPAGTISPIIVAAICVLVLVLGALAGPLGVGLAVLLMGLVLGLGLAAYFVRARRP